MKKTKTLIAFLVVITLFSSTLYSKAKQNDFRVKWGKIAFTKIKVKLNKGINQSTINENSIYLIGKDGIISRDIRVIGNGKLIIIKPHGSILNMLRPLVLVMTPSLQSISGQSLSRGYIKVFNVCVTAKKRPKLKPLIVSRDPYIEIAPLWFSHFPLGKLIKKFGSGKPDKDERNRWNQLKKAIKNENHKYLGKAFKKRWWNNLPPVITVTGITDNGTYTSTVNINVDAIDPEGKLIFSQSFLNFSLYINNTSVTEDGNYWFFTLASDIFRYGAYKFLRFSINKTTPEFISLTPSGDITVTEAELTVSGEVTNADKVTINGVEVPLNNNLFQQTYTLTPGQNPFEVKAINGAGNEVQRKFIVTYISDTTPPQIIVTSPANGAFLNTLSPVITGTITDASGILYIKGNGYEGVITGNDFVITGVTLVEGENSINIEAEDMMGNKATVTLNLVADTILPQIDLYSPQAGSLTNSTSTGISGKITDIYPFKIFLNNSEGELFGGNFLFQNVNLSEGENIFTIAAEDRAGNRKEFQFNLFLDTVLPQLSITSPISGTLISGNLVVISGTVSDVNLKDVKVGGQECTIDNGLFTISVTLSEGSNIINVIASDDAGNTSLQSITINVDTHIPILNISSPVDNITVSAGYITISGTVEDMNISEVKVNGNIAQINGTNFSYPSLQLTEGTNLIEVEAFDTAGNYSKKSVTVVFDSAPPQIDTVLPVDGTNKVPLSSKVTITFSEPVDIATLDPAAFNVKDSSGIRVQGNISIQGNMVEFSPDSPFKDSDTFTITVTAAVKDKAGNGLTNPYTGTFSTPDETAPALPVINAVPEKTGLDSILLTGTAEALSMVTVSGGLMNAEGYAEENGNFSINISLNKDQLNTLCIKTKDAAGNISAPVCVSIYQENIEFKVIEASYENNEFNVIFSNPVDRLTVTDINFKLSSHAGIESGTFSFDQGDTEVKFFPQNDLTGVALLLEIGTGLKDKDGNKLFSPYIQLFNSQSADVIVHGKVFNDFTGLPIEGAQVKLISVNGAVPQEPVPATVTTESGEYVLQLSGTNNVIRVSKEGYTFSDRVILGISGFSCSVFDSRLFPKNIELQDLLPEGGILNIKDIVLIYPESCVTTSTGVTVTEVTPQSLRAKLPYGWSPVASIDISTNGELLKPFSVRVKNKLNLVDSSALVAARWDEEVFQWRVISTSVSVAQGELSTDVDKPGFIVILIKDTLPVSPPEQSVGNMLTGVSAGTIPETVTPNLTYKPSEIYPGDRSEGSLIILPVVSSGVPVQAKLTEDYELLSGQIIFYKPWSSDLTLYNFGGNSSKLEYFISPTNKILVIDIKMGTMKNDIVKYDSGVSGVVVGNTGGTVTGEGGSEIIIPAGAVTNPIAVTIKKIEYSEITTTLPSGFEVLGAVDISLSGAKLTKAAQLSLLLTETVTVGDSTLVLARLKKSGIELTWFMESSCTIESSIIKTKEETLLPLEGVRQGGTFLFLKSNSPSGFVKGDITFESQPLHSALVSLDKHELRSESLSNGSYANTVPQGTFNIEAKRTDTGDTGTIEATMPSPGQIVTYNINIIRKGPEVIGITPADSSESIPLNSKVIFLFSKNIKASTFNSENIYISDGSNMVPGSFSLSEDGNQGEFLPAEEFPSDSNITITVSTGLMDTFSNPMQAVFTSSFRTIDVTPPEADYSKISVIIPENGFSTVKGVPGSAEPGSTIAVFNPSTGKVVNMTVLSDGSFELSIEAEMSDTLSIKVIDGSGNIFELDNKPFVSIDGRRIILGTEAHEFITPDGIGIKIEEGTFSGLVNVGIYEETNPIFLSDIPEGYARLKAVKVDFCGMKPNKPFKLSVHAPQGITENSQMFIAKEENIFGDKKLMVVDTMSLNNGRIEVNSPPWPGLLYEGIYTMMLNQTMSLAYLTSSFSSVVSAVAIINGLFVYVPAYTPNIIMLAPVGEPVTLTVRDMYTGETLSEITREGPTTEGQSYNFGSVVNDKIPPCITGITGLTSLSFDVSAREIKSGGIFITPVLEGTNVNGFQISGEKGTAVIVEDEEKPAGKVRIYKLDTEEIKYKEVSVLTAERDGSFSGSVSAIKGDKVIVSVERGEVALNSEFVLSFSEPLFKYSNEEIPLRIIEAEYEDTSFDNPDNVKILCEILSSGMGISVITTEQLKEGTQYILEAKELKDSAGNPMSVKIDFRTKESSAIHSESNISHVYDTLLYGGYLYIATGDGGIRVMDVSNPSNYRTVYTFTRIAGVVRSLALDSNNNLVVVGGGVQCLGYIKVLDISNPLSINQIKTQNISEKLGTGGSNEGSPRKVKVIQNYAFVPVYGDGLVIVDINKMESHSCTGVIIGRTNDEWVKDIEVYTKNIKNADNTITTKFYAVLLIEYFGIKILDVTTATNPVEMSTFDTGMNRSLRSLELVTGYWVDVNKNGKPELIEDLNNNGILDEGEDFNNNGVLDIGEDLNNNGIMDKEERDLAFFAVSRLNKIFIYDITNPLLPESFGEMDISKGGNTGDMFLDTLKRVLYVNSDNGLLFYDMNFSGYVDINEGTRLIGQVHTSGRSRFGLTIDTEMNMAYTGQFQKGVDIIKLANPELKIVYKQGDNYVSLGKICPYGIHEIDNPKNYPSEIYLLIRMPGGIGAQVEADIFSTNSEYAPLVLWGDNEVKPFIKGIKLYRKAANAGEENYTLYISDPIRIKTDPRKDTNTTYKKLLSGNIIKAVLSKETALAAGTYLTENDCLTITDEKISIPADLIDRKENIGVAPSAETTNSPTNNPSVYSGTMLHSGEYVNSNTDLYIKGRGFDFAFTRTYRSQSIYSGSLGFGWDFNYNKRMNELDSGDIIYYNGSGRRERFCAIKENGNITGYNAPKGYFVELTRKLDGSIYLKYSNGFFEIFDRNGRLIKMLDRNFNNMEFYYDHAGKLSMVMDTMGRLITLEYYPMPSISDTEEQDGTSGRLWKITDYSGREVEYTYNKITGDLIKADIFGRSFQYTYNTNTDITLAHNLKTLVDPKAQTVITVTYDENDKVTNLNIGGSGSTITSGLTATVTDGNGNTKTYTHNTKGNPISVTEGAYTTGFEFNEEMLITKVTYPDGNFIENIYDSGNTERRSQGNRIRLKENPGSLGGELQETVFTYSKNTNTIKTVTDPKNFVTTFELDGQTGNVNKIIFPDSTSSSITYDKYGRTQTNTDPRGKITEYEYFNEITPYGNGTATLSTRDLDPSAGGMLKKVTVDKGGDNITSSFKYNNYGFPKESTDGSGVKTEYLYNTHNEPIEIKEAVTGTAEGQPPLNIITSLTRDNNGNVGTLTKHGITTTYTYNIVNKPISEVRTGGDLSQTKSFQYDLNFNLKEITYPRGNKDTFTYDSRDLLSSKTEGGLTTTSFTYTGNGLKNTFTDGEGKVYTFDYDGHNRLKEVIDPLGNKVNYTFDKNSNLATNILTGSNGKSFNLSYEYNNVNDVLKKKLQSGTGFITTQYGYNQSGQMNSLTDPNSNSFSIPRTGSGMVHEITDPLGNKDTFTYDNRGLVKTRMENESGGKSLEHTMANDALGKTVDVNDSLGRNSKYFFSEKQLMDTESDPEGGIKTYEYDGFGRLKKEKKHIVYKGNISIAETVYDYDANGNLIAITDPNGNVTTYAYDFKDRFTRIIYPDGLSESVTYDNNDRVKTSTDMNGTLTTFTYDDAGRLTEKTIAPGTGVEGVTYESFAYDGLSRIVSADNNYSRVEYEYNKEGRVIRETLKLKEPGSGLIIATYNVAYEYDLNGNVTKIVYPSGKTVDITPDQLNRISRITGAGSSIASYGYEGRGKVTEKTLGNNVLTMNSTFDTGKRPVSLSYVSGGKTYFNNSMSWTKTDLKTKDLGIDNNVNYNYDSMMRLRKQSREKKDETVVEEESEYDINKVENITTETTLENGKVETKAGIFNSRNQLTERNGTPLTYDNNGNLKSYEYQYFYDYSNRLVRVETGTGVVVEYIYDAFGRRIIKTVTDPNTSETKRYIHSGHQVIEERNENNNLYGRFTYGNGLDEPVEIEKDSDNNGTLEPFYPMQDTIGSIRGIADNTGKLTEKVTYGVYGGSPVFTYDNTKPKVEVVRVISGDVFFRFSEPVDTTTTESSINILNGASSISGSISYSDDNRVVLFTPSVSLPQGVTLTVQVTTGLKDVSGNALANEFSKDFVYTGSDQIVFDRGSPEVESIEQKSQEYFITFTEEIDGSTISNSVEIKYGSNIITGTITPENDKEIKFVPGENLTLNASYEFIVKTGLKDLIGNSIALFSSEFTYTSSDKVIYEKPDENEHNESVIGNTTLFQGREYESETGLYYFRARYFHPKLGRFLQPDPKGYVDSTNLYSSFNQNPVNFADPMGEDSFRHKYVGASPEEKEKLIQEMAERAKSIQLREWNLNSLLEGVGLKGPIQQLTRLLRGEFKEFGKVGLENLERAFNNPVGIALMFSGRIKYVGPKPVMMNFRYGPKEVKLIYKFKNKLGKRQWREADTGRYTSPKTIRKKYIQQIKTPADALTDMVKVREGKEAFKKFRDSMTSATSGLDALLKIVKDALDNLLRKKK